MRKINILLLVVLALLAFTSVVSASPPDTISFFALMNGDQEVPVRETPAIGATLFRQRGEGGVLDYMLIVANIENIAAAHIHCGAVGVSGPVGVTLFVGEAASGPVSGVIEVGTIKAPDANNGCEWDSMDAVLDAIESGNAYVNVHTNDGVEPTNTGPGDFPGGEIRGQILLAGPSSQ
ncbi:MAG TPA: CHRD domain-containing protein [Anaerolineaceae bacterium]|nr:CHRD domain-containing protein [Anaerolineaceae bacterium]